jgi:hypothetical protein
MSYVPVESVKKKMEKELHMIRREKEGLTDVLDRTNAIAKGLMKNVTELQSRVQKVSLISILLMKLTNGHLFENTNKSVSWLHG